MRRQHGTQANRQVERQVLFQQVVRQARSTIGAPVSGIDHDGKMWGRPDDGGRSRGGRGGIEGGWGPASEGARSAIARQARNPLVWEQRSSIQRIDGKTAQ